jgi:hypothetical protein
MASPQGGEAIMELTNLVDHRSETDGSNGEAAAHLVRQFRKMEARSNAGPFPRLNCAVDDAMRLLVYASETGISVDHETRDSILHAAHADNLATDEKLSAHLLAALAKLAAQLKPVTAATLKASSGELTKPTIRSLRTWTCVLALPIILFSVLAFVASSISTAIRSDITTANELAVKLRAELGTQTAPSAGKPQHPSLPPGLSEAEVVAQMQQYSVSMRAIDARTHQLNYFVFNALWDPFSSIRWQPGLSAEEAKKREDERKDMFELPIPLDNLQEAFEDLTGTYQDVRSYATNVLDLTSIYYGAITSCLLPVMYALLGTCAFLLRRFEQEIKAQTFAVCSRANWAHFLIAGIGGAVVGLFSNFTITQGASISPLAIAFLVGYGVDVFFSFLEGLMQSFTKGKNATA